MGNKKSTEKITKVTFDVFQYSVYIVYTHNIADSREKRKAILGKSSSLSNDVDGLHSYDRESFNAYIFFTPESTIGVIAHECFHAVWRMFKFFGAKPENEMIAYHLGHLVDKAVELKHGIKKKN